MRRTIPMALAIALVIAGVVFGAGGRGSNPEYKARRARVNTLTKAEIKRILNPATVDQVYTGTAAQVLAKKKRYDKEMQKLVRMLVEHEYIEAKELAAEAINR